MNDHETDAFVPAWSVTVIDDVYRPAVVPAPVIAPSRVEVDAGW